VASTRLNRAVVVDADNKVLGVITDADVLASVEPSARPGIVGALMRAGGAPGGKATASDLMHRDAPVVAASASLAEAAQLMVVHHRKILPVVDDAGRLLGVLDRADLLHAASGALAEVGRLDAVGDED
jgi:CBS domain-containing protein